MDWRGKARLQNAIAALPEGLGHFLYYRLQRHLGTLKRSNPMSGLNTGIEVCKRARRVGHPVRGATFLEIGTGRSLCMPLAFWLTGAERVVTVDLNPYLKEEIVREDMEYIAANPQSIERLFGDLLLLDRLEALLAFIRGKWRLAKLLQHLHTSYVSPGDAAHLQLPSDSVDFHTSRSVLEHIPHSTIAAILREGQRVLKPGGLFIHRVDFTDHFAHSDSGISTINFLQFTEQQWDKLAGNRFMYMNRLRFDDFVSLFQEANHQMVLQEPDVDPMLFQLLQRPDFKLDTRFAGKPAQVLATTGSWFVTACR